MPSAQCTPCYSIYFTRPGQAPTFKSRPLRNESVCFFILVQNIRSSLHLSTVLQLQWNLFISASKDSFIKNRSKKRLIVSQTGPQKGPNRLVKQMATQGPVVTNRFSAVHVYCTECTLRYTTVCFEYQFLSRGAVHLQNPPTRSRAAGLLARRRCPAVAAAAKPLERRRRRPPLGLDSCRRRRGAARSRDALAAWRRSACVHTGGGGALWIFAKPNKTLKSKRGTSQMGSFYFVVININVLGFMFC